MGFQLTKRIQDAQIDIWRKRVPISFSLPVPHSSVISVNVSHGEKGGSFELVLENYFNSNTFVENEVIEILRVGNLSYTGIVETIGDGADRSGIVKVITGSLRTPAQKYSINMSFSSATPYIRPNGQLINQPFLPIINNHYRLIGLDAGMVVRTLSQRTGLTVANALPFSYPVWRFEVISGGAIEAISEIANYACAHTVLRFDGPSHLQFIPWGADGIRTFRYRWGDTMGGIRPQYEISEFTDVVVQGSSDMTPWNSTYAGLPESLGQASFKAGPTNTLEVAGGRLVESSDDWVFPEIPGNKWISYRTEHGHFADQFVQMLGVTGVWSSKPANQTYNFTPRPQLDWASLATGDFDPDEEEGQAAAPVDTNVADYKLLYTWNLATKQIEPQGDIYPEVYVLPSNYAPRFTRGFDYDADNAFNCKLEGYGRLFPAADIGNPGVVGRMTPNGFGIPVYADPELNVPGFAADGSFWIGLHPHQNVVYTAPTPPQPKVDPDKIVQFGSEDYRVNIQNDVTKLPIEDEIEKPNPAIDTRTKQVVVPENRILVTARTDKTGDEAKKDRKAKITALLKQVYSEGLNMLMTERDTTDFGGQIFWLRCTGFFRITDGTELLISTESLPPWSDEDSPLVMGKQVVSQFGPVYEKPPATVEKKDESGTIDQATQPIEGNWSLYALKRKCYPALTMTPVGSPQLFFSYSGMYPYQPVNPKTVESSLLTDYWSAAPELTHLGRFARELSLYLGQRFCSFSIQVPYLGEDEIPQPGDEVEVYDIPGQVSTAKAQVTQVTFDASRGGVFLTITCGRLSIV